MSNFFPCGRLGTELLKLKLYALEMLVNHCPDDDPLLKGETLDVIIKRISLLSERNYTDVKCDVMNTLKEKHKHHKKELNRGPNLEKFNYKKEYSQLSLNF